MTTTVTPASTATSADPSSRQSPAAHRLGRLGRLARETLLTVGAVLGTLCLLLTLAGWVMGVKPLVFRSGSMSPAIGTGALGISRNTPAADLRPGDVVSVPTGGGNRVTHRLVSSTAAPGGMRTLVLKGDANKARDAEPYTVRSAYKVFAHVPRAGYVVSWAGSRAVQFGLGVFAMGMLLLILRRPAHHTRRRARPLAAPGDADGPAEGPTVLQSMFAEPRHRR